MTIARANQFAVALAAGLTACVHNTVVGSGQVSVSAACSAAPARAGTGEWVEAHKAEITNYEPPFVPSGQLVAIVFTHAGEPIPAANVLLHKGSKPPGDSVPRWGKEGPEGVFRFDSVEQRDYILEFRRLGLEPQWHAYRGVRGVVDTVCVSMRAEPLILELQVPLSR